MTTFRFLRMFIRDDAVITIVDERHSILYTGDSEDVPYALIANTRFTILGIGDEADLMLQITPIER